MLVYESGRYVSLKKRIMKVYRSVVCVIEKKKLDKLVNMLNNQEKPVFGEINMALKKGIA